MASETAVSRGESSSRITLPPIACVRAFGVEDSGV